MGDYLYTAISQTWFVFAKVMKSLSPDEATDFLEELRENAPAGVWSVVWRDVLPEVRRKEPKRSAIGLRTDLDAQTVRSVAERLMDRRQARRLLAVAAIFDGATRTEAAKIGGVTPQTVRDWVMRFNAYGPEG